MRIDEETQVECKRKGNNGKEHICKTFSTLQKHVCLSYIQPLLDLFEERVRDRDMDRIRVKGEGKGVGRDSGHDSIRERPTE